VQRVQLAREAAEECDQPRERGEYLPRITTKVDVRPDEGVDHKEGHGTKDRHEKLIGASAIKKDDST
jgi:hypothetical protein